MRLLKNVYRVCGPMYGSHQNVYAVRSDSGLVLIDTGMGGDYEIVQKQLQYWELDHLPIRRVLLTHAHCEHSGLAWRYQEQGARIAAHEVEAQAVETGNDRTATYAFLHYGKYQTCPVVDHLQDGDQIEEDGLVFTAIHAPGHSDGSLVYRLETEGQVVLFTGDTVLADMLCRESRLGWTGGVDYDQDTYVQTLERLSHLAGDVVLPGHGEICMKDGNLLLAGAFLRARLQLTTQPVMKIETESFWRKEV